MSIFQRLFGRSSAPPPWAGFFTADEYARFEALVRPALERRGVTADARAFAGGVLRAEIGGEASAVGLGPIARRCHGLPSSEWAAAIDAHLDRALESHRQTLARLAGDFEAARLCLKVQLMFERGRRPDWDEGLNYRVFAPGVLAVLNYDLPTVVHSVPAADVRGWGRPLAELLDVAAQNVRAETPPPEREVLDVAGHRIEQLSGDSYFVCSHALWLAQLAPELTDRGALVAVPSRHSVLFRPIVGAADLAPIDVLSQLAQRLYATVPGPVSSEVFWVRGDAAVRIPVIRSEDAVQVLVPEALSALVGESSSG